LLITELTTAPRFVELTFALSTGWWPHPSDPWRNGNSQAGAWPLLSPDTWLARLAESGFPHSTAWPQAQNSQLASANQHLLVAQRDAAVATDSQAVTSSPRAVSVRATPTPFDASRLTRAVRSYLADLFCRKLHLTAEELDPQAQFLDLGFDSILALEIRSELVRTTGLELESTLLFQYASLDRLSQHLLASYPAELARVFEVLTESAPSLPMPIVHSVSAEPSVVKSSTSQVHESAVSAPTVNEPIAIIGLACRVPGARDPESFWRLLAAGRDAIGPVPEGRWPAGVGRTFEAGFIERIEHFDAEFFGISPREARLMDPQQRLLLEVAWECLERAGYSPQSLVGQTTGVFIGAARGEYAQLVAHSSEAAAPHAQSGSATSLVATRLSYLLNLSGPSLSVDTACSSSLVAVHLACQSLRSGECDVALAGGVHLIVDPRGTEQVRQAGMLSPRGRCHTFDASADGFARGEGIITVLLKPLSRAVAEGDPVWGLIRGTAINNDGHDKAGLAAPSPQAQRDCLQAAYRRAGISPDTIGLLEAHGTGTALGDPIELEGLRQAFAPSTQRHAYCALGSVKTNIGHLEAASGLAGLAKALLALNHRQLPPSLHLASPNPHLELADSPFYLSDTLRAWPAPASHPRRAAVSSFGFGGTNAHIVLEEFSTQQLHDSVAPSETDTPQLFLLSAKSQEALKRSALSLAEFLSHQPEVDLTNLAFTLGVGRAHFNHRAAAVIDHADALQQSLTELAQGHSSQIATSVVHSTGQHPVAFVYSSSMPSSGAISALSTDAQLIRQTIEECLSELPRTNREAIAAYLTDATRARRLENLADTAVATFVYGHLLGRLWKHWGLVAAKYMGYGIGAINAYVESGNRSPASIAGRLHSALLGKAQPEQLAVVIDADGADISQVLAAIGLPPATIVNLTSQQALAITDATSKDGLFQALKELGARYRPISRAILPDFAAQPPLSEMLLQADETRDIAGRSTASQAKLSSEISESIEAGCSIFLELGPQPLLAGFVRSQNGKTPEWIASQTRSGDGRRGMLTAAARLYLRGIELQWQGLFESYRLQRLPLPTYPFESERYWIEGPISDLSNERVAALGPASVPLHPLLDRSDNGDWLDTIQEFFIAP
jgi:acyl transferase domain-containing protein/acyl carrier protein